MASGSAPVTPLQRRLRQLGRDQSARQRPLSGAELVAALLAAVVPTVVFELLKAWRRRQKQRPRQEWADAPVGDPAVGRGPAGA